jgi:hypothetical protein
MTLSFNQAFCLQHSWFSLTLLREFDAPADQKFQRGQRLYSSRASASLKHSTAGLLQFEQISTSLMDSALGKDRHG